MINADCGFNNTKQLCTSAEKADVSGVCRHKALSIYYETITRTWYIF